MCENGRKKQYNHPINLPASAHEAVLCLVTVRRVTPKTIVHPRLRCHARLQVSDVIQGYRITHKDYRIT